MLASPARTLMRRIQAKVRYRRLRDRKIAVDYIGREFELRYTRPLDHVQEWLRVRLVAYHPDAATINFAMLSLHTEPRITWSTDQFWSHYRVGTLRDA